MHTQAEEGSEKCLVTVARLLWARYRELGQNSDRRIRIARLTSSCTQILCYCYELFCLKLYNKCSFNQQLINSRRCGEWKSSSFSTELMWGCYFLSQCIAVERIFCTMIVNCTLGLWCLPLGSTWLRVTRHLFSKRLVHETTLAVPTMTIGIKKITMNLRYTFVQGCS